MTYAPARGLNDQMHVLFGVGTFTGMTDGQLLERFMAGRDEAGELAFEALVTRHGPMVMRTCRNLLHDPQDAHDAFQAVFLVLARRGNAIRDRRSIGSWLHGVALRVSARARVAAIRRCIRDRRILGAAQTMASVITDRSDVAAIERDDHAGVVHQELNRLPEKFRAPVVLCYLEGLTHDEAAARLSWPVGTVRSRLARARDRLRARLTRRGVTAPIAVGPTARWIVGDGSMPAAPIATDSVAFSREIAASIARTACQLPVGRMAVLPGVSASSALFAQGGITAMLSKKLLLVACAFLPIAITALGGAMFVVRRAEPPIQNPPAAAPVPDAAKASANESSTTHEVERLARELLDAARKRYEAQKAYYEEGRITIDRFVDASLQLKLAELRLADTDASRIAVKQRHVDRIKEMELREKAEMAVGRGTVADVSEIYVRRIEAQLDLLLGLREAAEMAAVVRRLNDLEHQVDQLLKERTMVP